MSTVPNYITPDGFKKLQEEFRRLFHEERPKLVETIAWAAGNGDRSENGDYIYGKRRLREIDRRLRHLRDRIESARVVEPGLLKTEKVQFGATVTVEYPEGRLATYRIVGEDEIEPEQNTISWRSPMARGLMGKTPGDEVEILRPTGSVVVVVKSVVYI